MSYEPRLLVDFFTLQQKSKIIEEQYWALKEPKKLTEAFKRKQQLYYYLYGMIQQKPIYFKKERILICEPELTGFNKLVRRWLTQNSIDYAIE